MAPSVLAIVVDNASTDGTLELIHGREGVQVIANSFNRGFAGAVNQGVESAGGADLILLLNPDAHLLTALDSLQDAALKFGLAAGKLTTDDGLPQAGFAVRRFPTPLALGLELFGINRLWPSNPVNRRYRALDHNLEQAGPVEQPAGAFLAFQRNVWDQLGRFDEQFHPVWFEDVDFCRRAVDAGYRIEYVPQVIAMHSGGHSVGQISSGCRATYWCVSLLKYAAKHFRPWEFRGICAVVVLSSVPRMFVGMIAERSFTPVTTYLKIMRLAGVGVLNLRT